jgi:hypothetical protein
VYTHPDQFGYAGAWWELSGQTFQAGHTYHVQVDLFNNWGDTLYAFFGADYNGSPDVAAEELPPGPSWVTINLLWTPQVTRTTSVHFGIRNNGTDATGWYLDNARLSS